MKVLFKISILLFSAMLIVNCGGNSMKAKTAAQAMNTTSNNGDNSSSGNVNEPLVAPDSLLKVSDIPSDVLSIIQKAPTTAGNSVVNNLLSGAGCSLLTTVLSVVATNSMPIS